MLSALATEPHILGASLFDNQHRRFAEYRNPHASNRVAPVWRPDGFSFDGGALTLFRGVYLDGERTGSIGLVFDLSDFHLRLVSYVKIASIVLLLSVLLAFIASLRMAHLIGDPMMKLAELAIRISNEKDYSVRAAGSSGREATVLIRAFNDMLARIEGRERDLSAALRSLRESEERYALAARGANDGLWDWNLITNEIYFSPRWNHMLGCSDSERWTDPEPWFSRIHPEDRDRVMREISDHCAGRTPSLRANTECAMSPGGISGFSHAESPCAMNQSVRSAWLDPKQISPKGKLPIRLRGFLTAFICSIVLSLQLRLLARPRPNSRFSLLILISSSSSTIVSAMRRAMNYSSMLHDDSREASASMTGRVAPGRQ